MPIVPFTDEQARALVNLEQRYQAWGKDLKQGHALLGAVRAAMPQYPLDAAFEAYLPGELAGPYAEWKVRPSAPAPSW